MPARRTRLVVLIIAPIALVLTVLAAGYAVVVHMPGSSHQGEPPPPDPAERELRERLRHHVEGLAGTIGERHYWRPEAKHTAADAIAAGFEAAGLEPVRQPVPTRDRTFHNIEARIEGRDPERVLVIGAHYDTVRGSPGADDNASGVATLLELARLLADTEPAVSLRLVAFANEEAPFFATPAMGSRVHAEALAEADVTVVGMIALEMVGYFDHRPGTQAYPPVVRWFYPDRGDFIAFVGNIESRALVRRAIGHFREHAHLPSEGMAAPELLRDIRRSDHASYWAIGVPALMITDTANFRNPHYHRASDTPETLDYAAMARLTAALAPAILDLTRE